MGVPGVLDNSMGVPSFGLTSTLDREDIAVPLGLSFSRSLIIILCSSLIISAGVASRFSSGIESCLSIAALSFLIVVG